MKMNHPRGGIRASKTKSHAKTPEKRNTFLKKERWVLLEVGSTIIIANDIVQVHTFNIKSNMIARCVSKTETPGF